MQSAGRLHALDSVRAFALLLGIAFHAAISFVPGMPRGLWAMTDHSPSALLGDLAFVSHIFRMALFFFIAGYFARMLRERAGTRGFWANRLKRIGVPLVAGWIVVFPAIAVVWTVGLTKVFDGQPPAMPEGLPGTAGAFPLTHLWFLYYLLWLYAIALGARAVLVRFDATGRIRSLVDRAMGRLMNGYLATLLLGLPVAVCLLSLPFWVYWQGVPTPDQSLIPQPASLVGYGTAFAVGWWMHRSADALTQVARRWIGNLALAVISTAVCLWLLHAHPAFTPVMPGPERTAFVLAYGVAIWGWVFALTGVALRFFGGYHAARRYVADASYWLYLAHLPVVAALQVWVGHWPLHWSLKYAFVLSASLVLLLLSYHYLVRSTFIGELLNGRKYPRRLQESGSPTDPPPPIAHVAELSGVSKRYGAVTALANVDLTVARGELLAVLGPNGAGKSTAVSLWLGLIQADRGSVSIVGGSPLEIDRRRKIGVMMQSVELPRELKVRELIALTASYYPDPLSVADVLARSGTGELAERLYSKLSGGQKRQVQFALAICGRPELLFLDEPTVGLDIRAREMVWNAIRELLREGRSIVLTTHYLEEAEALANRVVVLTSGQVIASGTVDDIRSIVSRRYITCESQLREDEIRSWPGVVSATREGKQLCITAIDAEHVVRRLLATDAELRRLEVRHAGLNEAFSALTQEAA